MPRYLIECPHSTEYEGCVRALNGIVEYGSHLITHADWGCSDGVHVGWLIVEVGSREEALQLVPPQDRADARVIKLRKWTREQIEEMMRELESGSSAG